MSTRNFSVYYEPEQKDLDRAESCTSEAKAQAQINAITDTDKLMRRAVAFCTIGKFGTNPNLWVKRAKELGMTSDDCMKLYETINDINFKVVTDTLDTTTLAEDSLAVESVETPDTDVEVTQINAKKFNDLVKGDTLYLYRRLGNDSYLRMVTLLECNKNSNGSGSIIYGYNTGRTIIEERFFLSDSDFNSSLAEVSSSDYISTDLNVILNYIKSVTGQEFNKNNIEDSTVSDLEDTAKKIDSHEGETFSFEADVKGRELTSTEKSWLLIFLNAKMEVSSDSPNHYERVTDYSTVRSNLGLQGCTFIESLGLQIELYDFISRKGPNSGEIPSRDQANILYFPNYEKSYGFYDCNDFLDDPKNFIDEKKYRSGIEYTVEELVDRCELIRYEDWVNSISTSIDKELDRIYGGSQQCFEGFEGNFLLGFDVDGGSILLSVNPIGSQNRFQCKIKQLDGFYDGRIRVAEDDQIGIAYFKPFTFYGSSKDHFYDTSDKSYYANQYLGTPLRLD